MSGVDAPPGLRPAKAPRGYQGTESLGWFLRRTLVPQLGRASRYAAPAYWTLGPEELVERLASSVNGLSQDEADRRLREHGRNELRDRIRLSRLDVLIRQLRSPLLLLLVFAAVASATTGEWVDASIVITIVIASTAIGFSREYGAEAVASALRARVRTRCRTVRGGWSAWQPPRRHSGWHHWCVHVWRRRV
jgi:magnesium-transporting ATPase (P-type)